MTPTNRHARPNRYRRRSDPPRIDPAFWRGFANYAAIVAAIAFVLLLVFR